MRTQTIFSKNISQKEISIQMHLENSLKIVVDDEDG